MTFQYLAEFRSTQKYSDAEVTKMLREFHVGLTLLGSWILPALYGLLGTCVFYLRRFIDPNMPNPQWGQTLFRTALGAFVGVIAVGMFAQPSSSLTESTFASPAVFGIAFFAGFSMDLFLRLIDQISDRFLGGLGK